MYDNILVPTDGSKATQKAVEKAVELAQTFNATLHCIYVIDTSETFYSKAYQKMTEEVREEGRSALRTVLDITDGRPVKTEAQILEGTPFQQINSYAEDNDIDIIVMGTHGRTGIDRAILGSTTENVVRTADVPVMTVRMTEDDIEDDE